jgi:capsular exopolysaccharide synthesis family protein
MPVNSALGLFSGLFLGIAFVLVSERADRTLQEPGDAQYWTNLPELGVIPNAQISSRERAYGRTLPESDDADAGPGLRQIGRNQNPVEIISWKNKPSMVAEAFRTVLTSILFIGENGNRPKVLVLTSAGPGDGKTTVVSNLGIAMAEIRRKVLIIDADLRRPRMHDLFGLPNDLGLSTILREKSLDRFDLQDVIHETSVPGLFILPSGPPTASAANLLYSPNMAEILEKFKKEFDLVLIDTPPMLQMTDARVVGRLADAVIFVARIGQTTRDAAIAACQRFSEDRIRMIGTVLNDWNPKKSRNGYYGHYKGGYYSGSSYRSYGPSEVAER